MIDLIKYIDGNKYNNVYVVGDLHGEYTKLMKALDGVSFNYDEDLLLCVGDLVDRGEENEQCINLIDEEWFETVMGNHEDFCIQGLDDYNVEFYHRMHNNGGHWFYDLDYGRQLEIYKKFKNLPILMEMRRAGKKYGFVHADLPYQDWEYNKACLEAGDFIEGRHIIDHLIWARNIVNMDTIQIAQVDQVFFGHTPVDDFKHVGNCTFIDTGVVFDKNKEFKLYKI